MTLIIEDPFSIVLVAELDGREIPLVVHQQVRRCCPWEIVGVRLKLDSDSLKPITPALILASRVTPAVGPYLPSNSAP